MRFSKEQFARFDEIERAKYHARLHSEFRRDYPDMSDRDYDRLFEQATHGYRHLGLRYDDTIRDYIFLCFENRTALHLDPAVTQTISDMEQRGYPREEVISGIAGKTHRDQELL